MRRTVVIASLGLLACEAPSYEGDPLTYPARQTQSTTDELETEDDEEAELPTQPKTPKGACAGEATARACFDCCGEQAPENALDVYTKALEACLCQTPGTCATECAATLCGGTKANAACTTCVNGASACDDRAFEACSADAGCKALLTCASDSRCAQK